MIRNLAVYKEDGTDWTIEEYKLVCDYCEGSSSRNSRHNLEDELHKKYIFDDGAGSCFMFAWSLQEKEPNFKNCTNIEYEDFVDKYVEKSKETHDYSFNNEVKSTLNEIEELLISKNKKYGDSALNPKRIFSKANATEQIKVRIDDKLSRLKTQDIEEDEDVLNDLIGYLVLLKIANSNNKKENNV